MDKRSMRAAQKASDAAEARTEEARRDLDNAIRVFREASEAVASALELGLTPSDAPELDSRLQTAHEAAVASASDYAESVNAYAAARQHANKEVGLWAHATNEHARKHRHRLQEERRREQGREVQVEEVQAQSDWQAPIPMEGCGSLEVWTKIANTDLTVEEAVAEGVTIDKNGTVWVPPHVYVWCVIGQPYA